jgi:hypothetical protein
LQGAPAGGGATLTTVATGNGTSSPNSSTLAASTLNLVMDAANKLNLILMAGAVGLAQGQPLTAILATTTGGIQLNGVTQAADTIFDPSTYTLTAQGMFIAPAYQLALDATGQELVLTFTPVPEPATVLGLAGGGLGLAALVRRRRARCGSPC